MSIVKFVIAAPGLKLPKEGSPREYVTDARIEAVEASPYYVRAVADGDLLERAQADYEAQDGKASRGK